MKRSPHTRRRLIKRIALGLAVAAIAVPTAAAQDQLGPYSTDGPRAGGPTAAQLQVSTDGPRSGPSAEQIRQAKLDTFTTDAPRSGPATVELPTVTPISAPTGFDWRSAGVGIAIGIAASLLMAAVALVATRRRGQVPAH